MLLVLTATCLVGAGSAGAQDAPDPAGLDVPPTPRAVCGPGSNPETGAQGRVPRSEVESGRASQGYTCNTTALSRVGDTGGYKVERYVDRAGRECAYYDTTLVFPLNAFGVPRGDLTGVAVLDMSDPTRPVKTATLMTPAMQTPHETLALNQARGLLVAVSSTVEFNAGIIDVYDVTADCRNPVLRASAPIGALGHESGFAPDGRTFYVAGLHAPVVTAVDLSDPALPVTLGVYSYYSHGLSVSEDGNRLYMAANGAAGTNSPKGLLILDTSEIQARRPNPRMPVVSRTTWALVTTPQINVPVTIGGKPYLVEMDEFDDDDRVGAARIIDIADDANPKVVSNLRLEVHQAEARKGDQAKDPGADSSIQGYAGHYCNVPQRVEPGIVACTFILSGLRVFDIRDPLNPKEIAYFNAPIPKVSKDYGTVGTAFAMASPTFVPERGEIWYSDGFLGFFAVKLTNGVWPFPDEQPALAGTAGAGGAGAGPGGPTPVATLPATGVVLPMLGGLAILATGLIFRSVRARVR